jgi:hypothetical protein
MRLIRPRPIGLLASAALTLILGLSLPAHARAQGARAGDGVRVGVTLGGISTVGLALEYFHGHRSIDLNIGTWSFRDVSASLVVKEYFGAADALPFVGAGIWLVAAKPPGERAGLAAVLHAPVGVDWHVGADHYLGFALNVNRGIAVRRSDPEDDLPLNRRIVPLPGVYYRWSR